MKKLIIKIMLFTTLASASWGTPRTSTNDIILNQILKNQPRIDRQYASEVSRLIRIYASKYHVDPMLIAAIYNVESAYKLNTINHITADYGIGQVNQNNINKLKLDRDRLLEDLDYSIEQSIKIFSWFDKTYRSKGLKVVIGRYNCGTRHKCYQWKTVQHYINSVLRSM